ncbi:PAS domain-containing protein [Yinghuangia aomiensis]
MRDGPSAAAEVFDTAVLDALGGESAVAFALYGKDLRYLRISDALARLNRAPRPSISAAAPPSCCRTGSPARSRRPSRWCSPTEPRTRTRTSCCPRADWYDTRHHEARWVPVHGPDGDVAAVLAIVSDVTENRHREELLRSSQWRTSRLQLMTARLAGALDRRRSRGRRRRARPQHRRAPQRDPPARRHRPGVPVAERAHAALVPPPPRPPAGLAAPRC